MIFLKKKKNTVTNIFWDVMVLSSCRYGFTVYFLVLESQLNWILNVLNGLWLCHVRSVCSVQLFKVWSVIWLCFCSQCSLSKSDGGSRMWVGSKGFSSSAQVIMGKEKQNHAVKKKILHEAERDSEVR